MGFYVHFSVRVPASERVRCRSSRKCYRRLRLSKQVAKLIVITSDTRDFQVVILSASFDLSLSQSLCLVNFVARQESISHNGSRLICVLLIFPASTQKNTCKEPFAALEAPLTKLLRPSTTTMTTNLKSTQQASTPTQRETLVAICCTA